MEKSVRTIALCASISFYKDVVDVKNELVKLGYNVLIPDLAEVMERENNFDIELQKKNYLERDPIGQKAKAIMLHFRKIGKSDAILVVNNGKHGVNGYIGGNVLMEMGIAFYLGKPIYVMNNYEENKSTKDEIEGIGSIVIRGDLRRILL